MSQTQDPSARIDAWLQEWRQGDVVLTTTLPFMHLADYTLPLTEQARAAAAGDPDGAEPLGVVFTDGVGFAVLTQTCDLVRSCRERPFVELCVLKKIEAHVLKEVARGYRPRFAFIPALEEHGLVADLDCIMTVEKAILASISQGQHLRGCATDNEVRAFATAIARKHSRIAFPDEFVAAVRPIQQRIQSKHGRQSPEGKALAALREIRVSCAPSWSAAEVDVTFLYVFDTAAGIPDGALDLFAELTARLKPTGVFQEAGFRVTSTETMSAAEYLASDPFDLDHLSISLSPTAQEGHGTELL